MRPFAHDAVQALPDGRVRVDFKAAWPKPRSCRPHSSACILPRVLARHAPRAALLLVLSAACKGRGAEVAGEVARGFGEAMQVVAVIMLGIAAIGAAVYVAIWARLITTWRQGKASLTAALALVIIHAVALVLAGAETDLEVHRWLWWTAPLPAGALALAVTARLPIRLAVAAAATVGLCLLPTKPQPLRSLPAAIVDLSASYGHACVVLRSGEVVCAGHDFATDEDPGMPGPVLLTGASDADAVYATTSWSCVRHRVGPILCHGRSPDPSLASASPWPLPIGGPTSTLAVTETQILARTGDELQAWPHPQPAGLRSARALAANGDHFAVVDRDGELWMWQQIGAEAQKLARFPGLADAAEVAVQARTGACVRRTTGAVACFPWPEDRVPPFEVPDLHAVALIALDDAFDSFCVRKPDAAVVCWDEDEPPVAYQALPTATRLLSTDSALCDLAAHVRCVPTSFELPDPLVELLALPIAP